MIGVFIHASFLVKCILVFLVGCSVVCWSIVLYKWLDLHEAAAGSRKVLEAIRAGTREALSGTADGHDASPFLRLGALAVSLRAHRPREEAGRLLKSAQAQETERLASCLIFLATIGATAPFIGLLGTVWGIMDAFRVIGTTGSASLADVAPAISEALVATAAGLAVAIPAVMAYNFFVNWVRKLTVTLDGCAQVFEGWLVEAK